MKVVKKLEDLKGKLLGDVWLDSEGSIVWWSNSQLSWYYLSAISVSPEPVEIEADAIVFPVFRIEKGVR